MWRTALLIAVAGCTAAAAAAAPAIYRLDPQQTRVHFEVQHFGTSTSRGRFDTIDGVITLDRDARSGEVSIEVSTPSVDTGMKPFDSVLRRDDMLAALAHPKAYFVARQLQFDGDRIGAVHGEFTLRGTSRPLTLRALRFACRPHPQLQREVCGGDFEAELRRSDFGMHFGLPWIADRVRLLIQVEALRD
jgi:polyisoprenoid-binding protein YceI